MDIAIEPQKKTLLRRYWPVIPIVGAIIAIAMARQSFGSASYVVHRESLVFGDVQRGEFAIQIRGVGSLVPKNIQLLAANVDGRVDSIAVEAGARVQQGDVIASLSNPQLKERLEESRWELEAQKKENRASQMSLESQLADLRTTATNAELDYRSAKLRLDAEQALVEKGVISRLAFEQSKLAAEQNQERIKSQRERVAKMEANLAAVIEAHAARVNKMQNTQNLIQQQIDDLTIRARIDGVVQEMTLKLGQRVTSGTDVAKIAPHDNLVALLDIQDFQARDIALGQPVSVDTRSSKIAGNVVRIDPAVTNGVVKVEVALAGKMPPEARPDLSIEGIIDVERKHDALFVNRPTFAQSYSKATLYRLDRGRDTATRVKVELGRSSTRHIEVISGLKEGDRIIASDSSAWESHDNILIR
jgi:multidrug resistance efflux pump